MAKQTQQRLAIEPALELVELRAAEFRGHGAKAWLCLARRRADGAVVSD
jgi:hypothetical protein